MGAMEAAEVISKATGKYKVAVTVCANHGPTNQRTVAGRLVRRLKFSLLARQAKVVRVWLASCWGKGRSVTNCIQNEEPINRRTNPNEPITTEPIRTTIHVGGRAEVKVRVRKASIRGAGKVRQGKALLLLTS